MSIPKDKTYASVPTATRETDVSASPREVSSISSAAEVCKNRRSTVCNFIRDNMNVDQLTVINSGTLQHVRLIHIRGLIAPTWTRLLKNLSLNYFFVPK